ncbi:MAG: hypothetical protein ACXW2E_01560 [Nitrososphaeraceae archaeon]
MTEIISRSKAKIKGLLYYYTGKPCKHGHLSKRLVSNCICMECNSIHQKQQYKDNPDKFSNKAREYYSIHRTQILKYGKEYRENNPEYHKQYRKNNRDKLSDYYNTNQDKTLKYNRVYYKVNRDKLLHYNKQYRQDNQEKVKEREQKYYEVNQHKVKERCKIYRKLNLHKIAERVRIRNSYLYRAIPKWYETDLIATIYKKRDELNELWGTQLQVDHIIPLTSITVSGLHCWANLQLLDKSLNSAKGNRYETDW